MKGIRNSQVLGYFVTVLLSLIATGIAYYFSLLQQRDILFIVIIVLLVLISAYLLLWKININSYGIISLDKPHSSLNMNLQLLQCEDTFTFFGVSARTILDAQGGLSIKQKIIDNPNVKLRFLLLDPSEDNIGEKRAEDETGNINNWTAWKQIISASIVELKSIKEEISTAKIEVRVYKETPVFRSIAIDNKQLFINYYGKGFRPSETPNLRLVRENISLYNAFDSNFERVWKTAIKII